MGVVAVLRAVDHRGLADVEQGDRHGCRRRRVPERFAVLRYASRVVPARRDHRHGELEEIAVGGFADAARPAGHGRAYPSRAVVGRVRVVREPPERLDSPCFELLMREVVISVAWEESVAGRRSSSSGTYSPRGKSAPNASITAGSSASSPLFRRSCCDSRESFSSAPSSRSNRNEQVPHQKLRSNAGRSSSSS